MHVQQLASLRLWPLHSLASATARNGMRLSAGKLGEDHHVQEPHTLIDLHSSAESFEF